MSELKHWLDETSEADEFERSILRAGLEADPPQTTQDQIWSSLASTLAIAPLVAVTAAAETASAKAAGAGIAKAGVWLAVAKGFVVGLAVYGAASGVSELSNRLEAHPAPVVNATHVTTPPRVARAVPEQQSAVPTATLAPTSDDEPAPDDPPAPNTAPRAVASAPNQVPEKRIMDLPAVARFGNPERASATRSSQLEAETRALRRARDELRTGQLADAFATLEASQRQFSAPELYQEREALMIELLDRSGQKAAAAQRARAFLSRFPESPHAQQIRQFAAR